MTSSLPKQTTYALITMSYGPDFERCRVLHDTVKRFITSDYRHYIIVDRRDYSQFQELSDSHTQILIVEDLLPRWIMRMPFTRKWWLSLRSPPIRNWIFQQIVKIAISKEVLEDVLVFIDSDVAFIKTFNLHQFEKEGKIRLFKVPGGANIPFHYKWHRAAGNLLGIPVQDYYGARYIGNVVTWRRENVLKLHQHLEKVHKQDWMKTLAWQWNLSEYILYGVFVDKVLKDASCHYEDKENFCLEYWLEKDLTEEEIAVFLAKLEPHHAALMLSSKAPIPLQKYKQIIEQATEAQRLT